MALAVHVVFSTLLLATTQLVEVARARQTSVTMVTQKHE
jgi:hypothetical protein